MGLTQEELATLMGVTQAYISGKKQDLTLGMLASHCLGTFLILGIASCISDHKPLMKPR
ncbi:helix-turn-helix domain-containing protein [Legionella donaldsonii]|uniref:helix-turn-helix domain-containing protein n=1 Tax=Legionella donaldsonii TaxID=45060 RepID=UPI001C69EBEA